MMKLATKSQKKSNVSATNSFIFITLIPNILLYYSDATVTVPNHPLIMRSKTLLDAAHVILL